MEPHVNILAEARALLASVQRNAQNVFLVTMVPLVKSIALLDVKTYYAIKILEYVRRVAGEGTIQMRKIVRSAQINVLNATTAVIVLIVMPDDMGSPVRGIVQQAARTSCATWCLDTVQKGVLTGIYLIWGTVYKVSTVKHKFF